MEGHLFRAFRSRNYTLYFIGRAISQLGTWMQRTAVVWVVYSMTRSAFLVGVTIFAETFPSFLFSVFGGVAADRYDRFTIIKITQIASMVQSILLAAAVYAGHAPIWAIIVLSVVLGIINAFDVPARQTLFHEVVADPDDLPNALSLSTSTASLAQLLGPALSGIVISVWSASVCFLLNAVSFGGVLVSVLLMKLTLQQAKRPEKKMIADFADGFAYLKRTPRIGRIILMLAFVSLLVLPFSTVLPVFAKVVFKGDASTFGYITSFVGIGSFLGALFIASRRPGAHLRMILLVSTVLLGVGLIFFSQAKVFSLALFFAVVVGFGSIAQFTVCNIIVQSESDASMRGRTIGILLMAVFGMLPLGSLLVGAVSEYVGAPATAVGEGVIGLVIAGVFGRQLIKG